MANRKKKLYLKGESPGGAICIRLSKKLHLEAKRKSDESGVSLNRYCIEALEQRIRRTEARRARGKES